MHSARILSAALLFAPLPVACSTGGLPPDSQGSSDAGPDISSDSSQPQDSGSKDSSSSQDSGSSTDTGSAADSGSSFDGDVASDTGSLLDSSSTDADSGQSTCSGDSQCPATGSECILAKCLLSKCVTVYASLGTKLAKQTDGNCKAEVCDGSGNATSVNDDTDLPAVSGTCWNPATCKNGTLTPNPKPSTTSCGANLFCDGSGNCRACVADVQCGTQLCNSGVCAPASDCKELHARRPDLPSGPYSLPTSAVGTNSDTYCDMSDAGGGWTLCLNAAYTARGSTSMFVLPLAKAKIRLRCRATATRPNTTAIPARRSLPRSHP